MKNVIPAQAGIQSQRVFLFFAGCTFLTAILAFGATTGQAGDAYQFYAKALLLEAQGNFAAAQEQVEQAIALSPNSAYLHRTAAELALSASQLTKAGQEIERAGELDPDNVRILILAGQIEWALGNAAAAEEKLKRAVKLDPDQMDAVISLAGALTAKDPDDAITLYKSTLVRHPNDPELLERLAQLYQSTDKADDAEKTWQELLAAAPNSPRAHLALAQIAEVHMDTPTAIGHYDVLIAQDPTNLPLLLRVGELRYRSNDMAHAEDAFTKAKTLSPQSAGPNFWLALLAERRGDWPEAIRLIKQLPAVDKDSGILLRLSYYYSQNNQPGEAVKILKQLSATDPTNPDFLNYLAVAYEETNDTANAEKTLKQIIDIDPNDAEPHFHLATLYDRTKRFPLAEQELETAIRLKPDYDMAMNYLGFSYADKNIKLEEAQKLVNDAIAIDPHNPAYLDSMGWVYYRLGKFDRAKDFLTDAAAQANDAVVWDHLADVELAAGHAEPALLAWEQSLRLAPDAKDVRKKYDRVFHSLSSDARSAFTQRRAVAYFGGFHSIQGLVKATAKLEQGTVSVNAQFTYAKNGALHMEMPGPLGAPLFSVTKSTGQPTELNVLDPQLNAAQPLVRHAFDRLSDVLSAAAFQDKAAHLAFDAREGTLSSVTWPEGTLTLSSYDPLYFSRLPETFTWQESGSKQSLKLQFVKPAVEIQSTPDH